jgi:hypothetical protein
LRALVVSLARATGCIVSGACHADYFATGPIETDLCSRFFFVEKCQKETVAAVRTGNDANYYQISDRYSDVTEYRPMIDGSHLCFVQIDKQSVFAWLLRLLSISVGADQEFFKRDAGGALTKISGLEFLRFKCERVSSN